MMPSNAGILRGLNTISYKENLVVVSAVYWRDKHRMKGESFLKSQNETDTCSLSIIYFFIGLGYCAGTSLFGFK